MVKRLFVYICIFLPGILHPALAQQPAPCYPPTARVDLDINNVRATLSNGNDVWWDDYKGAYEIPKGSGITSMYTCAMWCSAIDANGQLKVAAPSYRSKGGAEYWPGPLQTTGGATDESACGHYDRLFKINRTEVDEFIHRRNDPTYTIPASILDWPGNGDEVNGYAATLAPFHDANQDGVYNPHDGDYPGADPGTGDCAYDQLGDQSVWWVFNDNGNTHTQAGGLALRLEVQAHAFAFSTDDEINNTTFYSYKLINRSSFTLNDAWVGWMVDTDLGNYLDDYIGCDVSRSMGYAYNGDDDDEGTNGYGLHPPAIGFDILSGPLAAPGDGVDNDRDGEIDEAGERCLMSRFNQVIYDSGIDGFPLSPIQFHYRLKGLWQDGSSITYGGYGYGSGVPCNFMLPGDSDPLGWGTNGVPQSPWSEVTRGATPADRSFIISTGPFTMEPGKVDRVMIAVPWARDLNGNHLDAITALQKADDKAQALFDACFDLGCRPPSESFYTQASGRSVQFSYTGEGNEFHWDFGDGTTSKEKYPSHAYCCEGPQEVTLKVSNACGTKTIRQTLNISVEKPAVGPMLTRVEGQGNGGQVLDLTQASITAIMNSPTHRIAHPEYKALHGPVDIRVTNPDALTNGSYFIRFDLNNIEHPWQLYREGSTDTVYADTSLAANLTQDISEWGLSVRARQVENPGNGTSEQNGLLEATMTFDDPDKNWLTGLHDKDRDSTGNWIRAGITQDWEPAKWNDYDGDPDEYYEQVLEGTWAPYRLASHADNGPAYPNFHATALLADVTGIDLVITSDTNLWSRCPVIETGESKALNEGSSEKFTLRAAPSVNKSGLPDGTGTGMGWFPGYAINVETGERMNVAFGEDSWQIGENGRDMLWNPTEHIYGNANDAKFGGKHFIYIFNHDSTDAYNYMPVYDEGVFIQSQLTIGTSQALRKVYGEAIWVNIPLLNPGHSLLETDAHIRLRVQKPYRAYQTSTQPVNNAQPLYSFSVNRQDYITEEQEDTPVLYPNPFSTRAWIQSDNFTNHRFTLSIYDRRGRMVRSESSFCYDKVEITRLSLTAGIYIYRIVLDNGKTYTGKMVVCNPGH
ncbi:MAG: T9SS type A sorting domain-containing protein [Flavobacteriales bacterium]|nr:T9SS type A sorting domain-containing protein [Flavobacteriales bacterium]